MQASTSARSSLRTQSLPKSLFVHKKRTYSDRCARFVRSTGRPPIEHRPSSTHPIPDKGDLDDDIHTSSGCAQVLSLPDESCLFLGRRLAGVRLRTVYLSAKL